MKHLLARTSAVVLVAVAGLTAACSNNDPVAPSSPSAARTPSIAQPAPNSFVGVGARPSVGSPATGNADPTSGYTVTWGRNDPPPPQAGQQ
ncbi:MAG TPA: hypothetical protein VGD56_07445 [Gemmatirosa sp.]